MNTTSGSPRDATCLRALALQRFMAERGRARETLEVKGAAHVALISYADTVAGVIVRAAKTVK